jgi:hypothetical protein
VRTFLPLPNPTAVYAYFWSALAASRDHLQLLDAMIAYLSVQIIHSPELMEGSVLAIDAISCSNTLLGMKHADLSEVVYFFVIYLQPINPNIKCCPLFVIESESGIGSERIRTKVDEILARIQLLIPRRFIAFDGDSSYYEFHRSFMDFWEPIYRRFGLNPTLEELRRYPDVMRLSDLLHLGKNFKTRFLKHELTFVGGGASSSINQDRVCAILDLVAPLTDLSQVGKMRDAYPLVLTRIDISCS